MFCAQGDVISNFLADSFKRDFNSTLREPAQINNCLDISIRTSLLEDSPLKDRFYFISKTNEIWGINAFNMEEHFELKYNYSKDTLKQFRSNMESESQYAKSSIDHIIKLLFDEGSMAKYNKIFFFFIRIRRINDLLKIIWDFTNSADLRRSSLDVYTRIRKVQFLRHKMQQFFNNLMQYIMNEVVDKLWRGLLQKITEL
jgi:hypothetical protein